MPLAEVLPDLELRLSFAVEIPVDPEGPLSIAEPGEKPPELCEISSATAMPPATVQVQ